MSTITQEYTHLKIKGSLGVVPITPEDIEGKSLDVYILMGGSGSGKSSFIELLSPDQKLEISGDSLESVTQEVVCYQIVNMTVGKGQWTVVLMDTPGFRDPRMSESRIMAKIMDALDSLRKSASRVPNGIQSSS
ncbi:hypothetical protein BJ165DRAFT_870353 [Panaeolus papilionaceus]|nr:hypothetical protein BJ165DRAFT_870353 [Panaeolus papilionaceus]